MTASTDFDRRLGILIEGGEHIENGSIEASGLPGWSDPACNFVALGAAIATTASILGNSRFAGAESALNEQRVARPEWTGDWLPMEPKAGGWDWVRLKSDEWVKGELLLMRDFDLNFDSDEFGIVEIDWDDVAEILTDRAYTLVLQDMRTSHTGTVVVRGDRVAVRVDDRVEEFDRAQVVAITPGANSELNLWSARGSVGLGLRSGNTDQSEITGRLSLAREAKLTRLGFDYNGAYGSLDNEKNTNNHRGRVAGQYFLTRDFYLVPAGFEVFTDEFQNISYRLTPTTGVGYYLVRRSRVDWTAAIAGGYQHTRIDSAQEGDSKNSDNGAITFGTTLDADLNSRVDLILEYQLQLIVPDTHLTNHHSAATLEVELTSALDLDVSFIWDRIEDPARESDGSVPARNDFRLSVGLGIEF